MPAGLSNLALWALNLLQVYQEGEEAMELHEIEQALDRLIGPHWREGQQPEAQEAPREPGPPQIGSPAWFELMEHLETEAAAWPDYRQCRRVWICP